jgi:poly-gamma-glutamate capsule biosynthesis protein CapA/YwtB (metallophosphatase superfamily)
MIKTRTIHMLIFVILVLGYPVSSAAGLKDSIFHKKSDTPRAFIIEDFDDGLIQLESYPGEDMEPSSWELNSVITYQNSPYSLKLYGNTWKLEDIQTFAIDSGDVWQVSAYIESPSEIQGFGITDGVNVLFYSFAGTEELNSDEWVPVYQGSFPQSQWNNYQLPVADDWLALFGYLPEITAVVYVNDNDGASRGVVYFDQIIDISHDLPISPLVSIHYSAGKIYRGSDNKKLVDVQFTSIVIDPDSNEHDFFWNFGDDSTSTDQNPMHTYLVEDDHQYTVLLQVVDPTNRWGRASCKVVIDPGSTSYPITLNFVGDIMLGRNYEIPGGIIPTHGVNYIFEPTKPNLGDIADITVANLECCFTTYTQHHPTKPIYFKSSPANIAGLSYAGIDIVSLANNHTLDYLLPGLQQTQFTLKTNNILYSGAGASAYEAYLPAFYSKSGVNFAFLAASDRTGQYNNYQPYLNAGFNKYGFANLDEYYIKKQIDAVKGISDLIIAELHCGYEYSTSPKIDFNDPFSFEEEDYSPFDIMPDKGNIEFRHYVIDSGADLVICHHSHIIQPVELYKGKLIAHSLGNFVFDLEYQETCPSMILNTKVNETGFCEFSITPVYIDDYIPLTAKGGLGLYILDDIAKRSKDLDTYLKVDREKVMALVIMDTLNMVIHDTVISAQLNLTGTTGNWLSAPYPLKKKGDISLVNQIQPSGNYQFRLGREIIWFGNMEDEGCTLWDLNNSDENYCDTVAFSGIRSIQHKRDANNPYILVTNLEQKIICRSDTSKYSLVGYIKTDNTKNVIIEVQYFDNRNSTSPIGQENIGTYVNGNTSWTYYYKDLNVPIGTAFFDIRLNSGFPDAGVAYSWFDNVGIICWDEWGKYDIGQRIPFPNDYYYIQVRSPLNQGNIELNYSETVFYESLVEIKEPLEITNTLFQLEQNIPNPLAQQAFRLKQKPLQKQKSLFIISMAKK